MRVVIAIDSFKGCLTSIEAGRAAAAGVVGALPDADVHVFPLADGGEGTLAAMLATVPGELVSCESVDALGRPRSSTYALLDGVRTALIEAAETIGLPLVPIDDHTAPRASSFGLGRQVRDALTLGVDKLVIGLGGTATTDGGLGMLVALGARLAGPEGGNPLWEYAGLAAPLPVLDAEVVVLADVTNPLLGPLGAATVFGPQKGATPEQVQRLEKRMAAWAADLTADTGREVVNEPGAGAAGGLGAALLGLGATMTSGFDWLAERSGLPTAIAEADLVITGEGSLDHQSLMGKGPGRVAELARASGVPVVALAGQVHHPLGDSEHAFDAALSIWPQPLSLELALDPERAKAAIGTTAGEVARLVQGTRVGALGQRLGG